ncbi:GWxTD domain-containing protein, partial [Bacteroidota bacterium]
RSNQLKPALLERFVDTNQTSLETELIGTFVENYNRTEELEQYLRCLNPISTQEEIASVNNRINFNDAYMMKRFLFDFWNKRTSENPEKAWLNYLTEVEKVNSNYGTTFRKGYDTDRGRVYLQYGAPNTITPKYFEPNAMPYEIWHYYKLEDHLNAAQSNVKFIFANTNSSNNEFLLLHSDAKNEIKNYNWNYALHKRNSPSFDIDQNNETQNFGTQSKELFQNPY